MIIFDHLAESLTVSLFDTLRDSIPPNFINLQVILMTVFVDQDARVELELYSCNFSSAHYNSVGKCLSKFHKNGTYDYERAVKYIERNLVLPAAKDYLMCHGSMTQSLRNTFPKHLRMVVAEDIANAFKAEFELGNYWA